MLRSHLLSHEIESHCATLVQEAEHARLVRMARPAISHQWPIWFAFPRLVNRRLFWHQTAPRERAEAHMVQRNTGPALSASCCCACAL